MSGIAKFLLTLSLLIFAVISLLCISIYFQKIKDDNQTEQIKILQSAYIDMLLAKPICEPEIIHSAPIIKNKYITRNKTILEKRFFVKKLDKNTRQKILNETEQ